MTSATREKKRVRTRLWMRAHRATPEGLAKNRANNAARRSTPEGREANRLAAAAVRATPAGRERNRAMLSRYRLTVVGSFKRYRDNAARRGHDFEMSFEQFKAFWQKPCAYCGGAITTIGLDRVNNSVGYVVENVVPCCAVCNGMKHSWPEEFFIEHCAKIVLHRAL